MQKIKYWQRNGGLKVWPEVKITRLIDPFSAVFFSCLHNIFLKRAIFYEHSIMFCNFSLKLNMVNRKHVFSALCVRKLKDTLNKRKTKFARTCNVQKVIWALAFRNREKFDNSFLFKIVGIV